MYRWRAPPKTIHESSKLLPLTALNVYIKEASNQVTAPLQTADMWQELQELKDGNDWIYSA